jgi:hypothetical protein
MDYQFSETPDGTFYRNSLTIGAAGLLGRVVNPLIRRFAFDEARGRAWIRHNVEEVGNLESFLPQLYASEVPRSKTRTSEATAGSSR